MDNIMRPKKHAKTNQHDIFKSRLDQIINMSHWRKRIGKRFDKLLGHEINNDHCWGQSWSWVKIH